jgi:hypothetical protein
MGSSRLAASTGAVSAGGQEAAVLSFLGTHVPAFLGRVMTTSTGTGYSAEGRSRDGALGNASYADSTPAHAGSRRSTETKASFKTTELVVYIAAVVGVLIASDLVGTANTHSDYFRADRAWLYIVVLTIGYMVSRGLAKSGSREFYNGS